MEDIQEIALEYQQEKELGVANNKEEWIVMRQKVVQLAELLGRKIGKQEIRKTLLNAVEKLDEEYEFEPAKPQEMELRISPSDGMPYSKTDFQLYYMSEWESEWIKATVYNNTSQEQRRYLGTCRQFEKYFGKSLCRAYWKNAPIAREMTSAHPQLRWFESASTGSKSDFLQYFGFEIFEEMWNLAKDAPQE